jgi:hypothetical protein
MLLYSFVFVLQLSEKPLQKATRKEYIALLSLQLSPKYTEN